MARPRPHRAWNRRHLLQAAAGIPWLGAAGSLGRPARAAEPTERRFLFVFCNGGWDLSWGLVPMFDNERVDSPTDGSAPTEAGGHTIVDGPGRPAVRSWFDQWGRRTAALHGFEVRSVAHLNCRRLVFTGEASATADDWPTLIAAEGIGRECPVPHLIVSGPGFAYRYPDLASRVGRDGQLCALLDRTMLNKRDTPVGPLQEDASSAVQDYLAARSAAAAASAATPTGASLYEAIGRHQQSIPELEVAFQDTAIGSATTFTDELLLACDVLEGGLSRCALVRHNGFNNSTWDDHGGIEGQALHYQDFFEGLLVLMQELSTRTGPAGGTLLDETCVVVVSEMSRHPVLNLTGGKDHWTWTSALLVGSGVAGGTVAGGYDSNVFGLPINPITGLHDTSGKVLQARHLGATLLALAGIDPTPLFPTDTPVIEALLA